METIWTFPDNESVETDKVDMKPFKPTARFFDDVITLTKMFNIKIHPALRESTYVQKQDENEQQHEEAIRDITALTFNKHRLDRNSLRTMFICLPPAQNIQTLK